MIDYDSATDTCNHIETVGKMLGEVVQQLVERAASHDRSKLYGIEKQTFDEITPRLRDTTYGSDEYRQTLRDHKEGIDHHVQHNFHHPEHYVGGINGMTLIDLVEMFCDWKAASMRHNDGDFERSLEISMSRFAISDQLAQIFENTRKGLGW
jgi:hypothetical protein